MGGSRAKGNRATKLTRRFDQAFLFASKKHAGQVRKGTPAPYISHLMCVTGIVLEAGGDEDLAIAALLHDVVEDCGGAPMLKEVRKRFGKRVAHVVEGCTQEMDLPWRERREKYIKHLRRADADTRLVSAADKLHNARHVLTDYREIGDAIWNRFNGGRDGTLWYYQALAEEFGRGKSNRITNQLQRVVEELTRETKLRKR